MNPGLFSGISVLIGFGRMRGTLFIVSQMETAANAQEVSKYANF